MSLSPSMKEERWRSGGFAGEAVESGIARTLTGDIYRADDRAIGSVNREIFAQQQQLATRIRAIRPQVVLAPLPGEAALDGESEAVSA